MSLCSTTEKLKGSRDLQMLVRRVDQGVVLCTANEKSAWPFGMPEHQSEERRRYICLKAVVLWCRRDSPMASRGWLAAEQARAIFFPMA